MIQIRHPESPKEIVERDLLLQASLRPFATPFPVAREYPTVLNPKDVRFSWGLYTENRRLVAHANLWPRVLRNHVTGSSMNVGLMGNVATDKAHWGRGHMSHLLEHLVEKAAQNGLDALILWSDLSEFYQKRGFSSCSVERRYTFGTEALGQALHSQDHGPQFRSTNPRHADPTTLLQSRFQTQVTLDRTVAEYQEQLGTAGLNLFVARTQGAGTSPFVCMGKGCDLVHVVHEWGAPNPRVLLEGIWTAGHHHDFAEVMLLCPQDLPAAWDSELRAYAQEVANHPMALARVLNDRPQIRETLSRAFIWGLDSI